MKIVKHILIWLGITCYLIVMLAFVEKEHDKILCRQISISIHDSLEIGFVTPAMIMKIIHPEPATLLGKPIHDINIRNLEDKLHEIRSIRTAEVFYDVEGHLSVDITQRQPMIRIIDNNGTSYCIDHEGYLIPLDGRYVPHILVVNGNVGFIDPKAEHISDLDKNHILEDIYRLCNYLDEDAFFKAQIVQVYVNRQKEFELIPRVGSHIILLGGLDDFEARLDNLKELYGQGFKSQGWNQFEIINLKYEHQIVCSKR